MAAGSSTLTAGPFIPKIPIPKSWGCLGSSTFLSDNSGFGTHAHRPMNTCISLVPFIWEFHSLAADIAQPIKLFMSRESKMTSSELNATRRLATGNPPTRTILTLVAFDTQHIIRVPTVSIQRGGIRGLSETLHMYACSGWYGRLDPSGWPTEHLGVYIYKYW